MAERLTDLQAAYLRALRDFDHENAPKAARALRECGQTVAAWMLGGRITPAGLEALRAWEAGR
jgi:hypothetical protein